MGGRRVSKSFHWLHAAAVAALLLTAQSVSSIARADDVEDFYKGKVVTILIGHPPGGSFDLYAQLAAQYFSKHIPGHPTVVVQGMPGGGGSLAAAYFANKAPHDGTMLALLPESLAHTQLLEPESSRWDVSKMRYIGSIADVTSVMMVRNGAPGQTVEQFHDVQSNVSCSGRTTSSSQAAAMLKYFTGVKFNMVCGYDSATASILAVFRGEADITTTVWTNWTVNYRQQMDAGDIRPVVQFGTKRLTDLPDTPTAIELVQDPKAKEALEFFAAGGDIGRALMVPPQTPDDRFQALAKSFDELMTDPDFLKDAKTRSIPIAPTNAAGVQQSVDRIFSTPSEVIALLKEAMEKGFEN